MNCDYKCLLKPQMCRKTQINNNKKNNHISQLFKTKLWLIYGSVWSFCQYNNHEKSQIVHTVYFKGKWPNVSDQKNKVLKLLQERDGLQKPVLSLLTCVASLCCRFAWTDSVKMSASSACTSAPASATAAGWVEPSRRSALITPLKLHFKDSGPFTSLIDW